MLLRRQERGDALCDGTQPLVIPGTQPFVDPFLRLCHALDTHRIGKSMHQLRVIPREAEGRRLGRYKEVAIRPRGTYVSNQELVGGLPNCASNSGHARVDPGVV